MHLADEEQQGKIITMWIGHASTSQQAVLSHCTNIKGGLLTATLTKMHRIVAVIVNHGSATSASPLKRTHSSKSGQLPALIVSIL